MSRLPTPDDRPDEWEDLHRAVLRWVLHPLPMARREFYRPHPPRDMVGGAIVAVVPWIFVNAFTQLPIGIVVAAAVASIVAVVAGLVALDHLYRHNGMERDLRRVVDGE